MPSKFYWRFLVADNVRLSIRIPVDQSEPASWRLAYHEAEIKTGIDGGLVAQDQIEEMVRAIMPKPETDAYRRGEYQIMVRYNSIGLAQSVRISSRDRAGEVGQKKLLTSSTRAAEMVANFRETLCLAD